jgi:hypothetical protein
MGIAGYNKQSLIVKKDNMGIGQRSLLVVLLTCLSCGASRGIPNIDDDRKNDPDDYFLIGFETASAPAGRILLFRSSTELCALKINAYGKTVINDAEVQYAEYELVRISVGEKSIGPEEKIESGRLEFKGWIGFGHWAWTAGKGSLKCGAQRFSWSYPANFGLNSDAIFAAAPTAWKRFADVRLDAPALVWYSEDKSQKRIRIKLSIDSLVGYAPSDE